MKQHYSAEPASVRVRQCKQRTVALISALVGRKLGYNEAMKVKRDLAAMGMVPRPKRMLPGTPLRDPSLASKARAAGIKPQVVWSRIVEHGWSEDRALSVPVRGVGLSVKARAAGLPPDMVCRRIREGMSEEQALTTPVSEKHRTSDLNDLASKARAVGLTPDTVRFRVRNGWSEERALTTPSQRAMILRCRAEPPL